MWAAFFPPPPELSATPYHVVHTFYTIAYELSQQRVHCINCMAVYGNSVVRRIGGLCPTIVGLLVVVGFALLKLKVKAC